jgi:hypothetical protein
MHRWLYEQVLVVLEFLFLTILNLFLFFFGRGGGGSSTSMIYFLLGKNLVFKYRYCIH